METHAGWFLENAWIIPLIMAGSFAVILFIGKRLSEQITASIGILAVAACLVLSIGAATQWVQRVNHPPETHSTEIEAEHGGTREESPAGVSEGEHAAVLAPAAATATEAEGEAHEDDQLRPAAPCDELERLVRATDVLEHLHVGTVLDQEAEARPHHRQGVDHDDAEPPTWRRGRARIGSSAHRRTSRGRPRPRVAAPPIYRQPPAPTERPGSGLGSPEPLSGGRSGPGPPPAG